VIGNVAVAFDDSAIEYFLNKQLNKKAAFKSGFHFI